MTDKTMEQWSSHGVELRRFLDPDAGVETGSAKLLQDVGPAEVTIISESRGILGRGPGNERFKLDTPARRGEVVAAIR